MESADLLILITTTAMSREFAPPLVAIQQCNRRTARSPELVRLLYSRCSTIARSRGHTVRLAVSNMDAMAVLAAERNRVIDRMLHQLRAVWSWMITELAPAQIQDATTVLFGAAAAWQPVEVILADTDEDGDILMADPEE